MSVLFGTLEIPSPLLPYMVCFSHVLFFLPRYYWGKLESPAHKARYEVFLGSRSHLAMLRCIACFTTWAYLMLQCKIIVHTWMMILGTQVSTEKLKIQWNGTPRLSYTHGPCISFEPWCMARFFSPAVSTWMSCSQSGHFSMLMSIYFKFKSDLYDHQD